MRINESTEEEKECKNPGIIKGLTRELRRLVRRRKEEGGEEAVTHTETLFV